MELDDLPLSFMNIHLSEPRQDALDFLERHSIPSYIFKKYESLEDRADAFDGAFTAFHIYSHVIEGASKEDWLFEILEWYEEIGQKNLRGPFFDGLRTTLESCRLSDFYMEAIGAIQLAQLEDNF